MMITANVVTAVIAVLAVAINVDAMVMAITMALMVVNVKLADALVFLAQISIITIVVVQKALEKLLADLRIKEL